METDTISEYIETCIGRSEELAKIVRLIAIQSFCNNGLKKSTLDFYKREIVQAYGYEHMLTLDALEQAGILRVTGTNDWSGRQYASIRNRFKLTWNTDGKPTRDNSNVKPDLAHVHNGYTPFSVRLVQHIDQFGFRSLNDALQRHLSKSEVPLFDEIQQLPPALRKRRNSDATSQQSAPEANQKLMLVFYLGGCTHSEISSIRLLSHKEGTNSEFIVATTSIITSKTFLQSLSQIEI